MRLGEFSALTVDACRCPDPRKNLHAEAFPDKPHCDPGVPTSPCVTKANKFILTLVLAKKNPILSKQKYLEKKSYSRWWIMFSMGQAGCNVPDPARLQTGSYRLGSTRRQSFSVIPGNFIRGEVTDMLVGSRFSVEDVLGPGLIT